MNSGNDMQNRKSKVFDWILRYIKGIFIGSGFIIPGVSGGALAAVFGMYERIINFLAGITKNFKENLLFFIPVGLGGLSGIFILSFPVKFFMDKYEFVVAWFFIGCIAGTVPALLKQAAKKGRSTINIVSMLIAFIAMLGFLYLMDSKLNGNMPKNFATWALSGALIALGVLVPGLSPSNFLVLFGMYDSMAEGFSALDFSVLIPLALGAVACVLLFSKLISFVLSRAYAGMFHIILGVVFASTLAIIPRPQDFNYMSLQIVPGILLLAGGAALGWWMCRLEDKYSSD